MACRGIMSVNAPGNFLTSKENNINHHNGRPIGINAVSNSGYRRVEKLRKT
jgi:hypothetical protein